MRQILVTGGLGYIGSHTCVELMDAGYIPVVLDNLSNTGPGVKRRIYDITGKDIIFYEGDIRDRNILERIFASNNIGAVMHFAALKVIGESLERPFEYYDNNVRGTLELLSVMRDYGVKNMIFSSTAAVYGPACASPVYEDTPPDVITNPYARTKSMTEEILYDISRADSSWHIAILRYFNPIGAHRSGLIGDMSRGTAEGIMPCLTKAAAGEVPYLDIFGDDYDTPDGTCIRDYVHVCDISRGHVLTLNIIDRIRCEVYNLGTGRGTSVFELISTFERINKVPVPCRIAPRREGDIPVSYAACDKARAAMGFSTRYSVADMCRDSWNWQKNFSPG